MIEQDSYKKFKDKKAAFAAASKRFDEIVFTKELGNGSFVTSLGCFKVFYSKNNCGCTERFYYAEVPEKLVAKVQRQQAGARVPHKVDARVPHKVDITIDGKTPPKLKQSRKPEQGFRFEGK